MRRTDLEQIPFHALLGLRYEPLTPGRGAVALPDRAELHNHIQTQHAGALFSVAEAASGSAVVATFADDMDSLITLVRRAGIEYERVGKGEIAARARLDADVDDVHASLERDGRVRFSVVVDLVDAEGLRVAAATFEWDVRPRRSR